MDAVDPQIRTMQRQINLMMAIDHVRDNFQDTDSPALMYIRLLRLLVEEIGANAGAIQAVHEGDRSLDKAQVLGMDEERGAALCEPLLKADTAQTIHPILASGWAHGVGMRVILRETSAIGAVVLLREDENAPFTNEEMDLLRVAEDQIDSAIIQAQQIWRLSRRNRELDTIFKLDALRDRESDEKGLVNGFIRILLEQYEASFCVVFLADPDSQELTARGVVDRSGMTPSDYTDIRTGLSKLEEVGVIESPREDVHLLGAPFIINGEGLGGVVVGREVAFGAEDTRLMTAMSSQMDSAIVYSRVIQQLSMRNRELQIIYHIDQIRDRETDFDAMLQAVLGELCGAIESEMGYILLYSEDEEDQLEIKSSTESGILPSPTYYEAIHTISRQALESGDMIVENKHGSEVRSVIAVPLILRERVIGVFGGLNSRTSRGFSADDRRMLHAIVSQTDTAVFERLEQRRVRQVLGRSVDPKVLEKMLDHSQSSNILTRERMHVSVIFADLRGSTEWAERTAPDDLAYMLNEYLGRMTAVIFEYGGTLDKFVGDEVIGLFGAPLPIENQVERCAQAALKMQAEMDRLIREMAARGFEMPLMGVGVSTGEAICGEFGTAQRTDYTAMGRMMNLGARLCGAAAGGEVVISEKTNTALGDKAKSKQRAEVFAKGIGNVTAYQLLEVNERA